jgi:dihydrofolate reductase
MGRLLVVSFTTLDGVVEDPDGSDGTAFGGWAMRHGPAGIAGDKFRLGPILEHGTLLFGRRTWEHFRTLWPSRDDAFAKAMNAASKAVVTHRPVDESLWSHSRAVDAPLASWVRREVVATDIAVVGSGSVVAALEAEDLVQEYRVLIFPTVVGAGRRLLPAPRAMALVSSETVGPAVLSVLTPEPRPGPR